MPIYEYDCEKCGERFEFKIPFDAPDGVDCTKCGSISHPSILTDLILSILVLSILGINSFASFLINCKRVMSSFSFTVHQLRHKKVKA